MDRVEHVISGDRLPLGKAVPVTKLQVHRVVAEAYSFSRGKKAIGIFDLMYAIKTYFTGLEVVGETGSPSACPDIGSGERVSPTPSVEAT
ncbi:MAG: hypothetical protein J07HX5_00322 [halophilic archaeon J07HX5]|jgi:hypothetical protein|nr:MAG: hypothetical protein J07HX5_00322 [halophilic archaeon J07HX5]